MERFPYPSVFLLLILSGNLAPAQESDPLRAVPYPHLREADVMWSKRVWRTIDLREKINQPLYYPTERIKDRRSLSQVIIDGVVDGTLTAYEDNEFKKALGKSELDAILHKTDTLAVDDPDNPGNLIQKIVPGEFNTGDIVKYRIKEDWFFDKQRAVLDVRIIGICPVQDIYADDGSYKGAQPLFWIYYPVARSVFANAEVYNRFNDAERRTLEDIFTKRLFGSYIIKEANVYDRSILEYKTGQDALIEAEKIENDIFFFENDLWEF